ncbi:MAG: DNA repair protein, partial [Longimicrobiaceae bacterium]
SRPEEPPRLPESAPSLATAPGAAPQVVADARVAAAPDPAAPRVPEAQGPRTASAVPEVQ